MKILIPLFALLQLTSARASLIGIMDTGTDITHKDLAAKAWYNINEKAGSLIDLDKDGLAGDINGWDFTTNSPKSFDNKYIGLIDNDVKKFFYYESLYELGKLAPNSPGAVWLTSHDKDEVLMNKVNFVGGYIHGTHVAGISAGNNNLAKILSMKIIPTVYKPLVKIEKNPVIEKFDKEIPIPGMSVSDYTNETIQAASDTIENMVTIQSILKFHKVDVVNQSFGIGFNDAINFIVAGFVEEVKREPTQIELRSLVTAYFTKLFTVGPKMYEAAPDTLFTIAAGNDASDNDLYPDYPANIRAENKIVVAATFGYRSLAGFSNYGATKVDVAAPGVAITSTAPANSYIPLSGTSQATPYVTNIIAALKDLNPALKMRDLKAIVLGTVDVKSWLKGKVRTSGIVNKARALKAAELAKTQTVDLAIAKARATVADVLTEKSFSTTVKEFKLNYKPYRPSLLVPRI